MIMIHYLDDINSVKVATPKTFLRGKRGVGILLPAVWWRDNGLSPGDEIEIYRDASDRLIILPPRNRNEGE